MIAIRFANERTHRETANGASWSTFCPEDGIDSLAHGFGTLQRLDEGRLDPGGAGREPAHAGEVITYVREGAVEHRDTLGRSVVIQAGEFQRETGGSKTEFRTRNASRTSRAQLFQMFLGALAEPTHASVQRKRFSAAKRRGALCLIASPAAGDKVLQLQQDTLLYSALLNAGQHVVHEIRPGRGTWLHVVQGSLALRDACLQTGDGAGVTEEYAVSFTASEDCEVLLVNFAE